jgi:hypothetical protein
MNTGGPASRVQHAADVLDEHGPWPGLDDDPAGGWPEVAVISGASGGSGFRPRLARDAAK